MAIRVCVRRASSALRTGGRPKWHRISHYWAITVNLQAQLGWRPKEGRAVGGDAFKADLAYLAHPVRNAVCDFKAALRPSSLAEAQRALHVE